MVDILIKDELRASVEAASKGKQTVLYTAKGQPNYMNIVEKFGNDVYGAVDGMGAIHPAFYKNNLEIDVIYVGTYTGNIVNGELLSLPYVPQKNYTQSLVEIAAAARNCGDGFHLMSAKERCAVMYRGMVDGGYNRGNTHLGQDEVGHKGTLDGPLSRTTLTGSGGYTWTHDGSITGICDMAGNRWGFVTGMRIMGDEIQFQDNAVSYAHSDINSLLNEGWYAMDATSGGLITPTSTGTIGQTDFKATTPNSIRVSMTREKLTDNAFWHSSWNYWRPDNFVFGSAITETAKAQLKTFGVLPISTNTTLNTAFIQPLNNVYEETWFAVGGATGTESSAGMYALGAVVNKNGMTTSENVGRPCYVP